MLVLVYLMSLLVKEGYYLDSFDIDYADELKKDYCFFVEDFIYAYVPPVQITFPSGQSGFLGDARFEAPEILFLPPLADLESIGLADAIFVSLENVDSYMQDKMMRNVVLGGGNSMLRELKERLQDEFYDMEVSARKDREYSAWIGASKWSS